MEKQLHHHRFQKKHEIKLLDRAISKCHHLKRDLQSSLDVIVQLREKYCDQSEDDFNRLCVEIISGQTSLRMDSTPEANRCSMESRASFGRCFSPDSGFDSAYDPSEKDDESVDKGLIFSTPKRARRAVNESLRLSLDSSLNGHRTPKQLKENGNYLATTTMKIERDISACIRGLEFKFEKYGIRKKQ